MKKRYIFTLTDEVAKILRDASEKTGLKMSTIVEKAIAEFTKK